MPSCKHCHAPVALDDRFCRECGTAAPAAIAPAAGAPRAPAINAQSGRDSIFVGVGNDGPVTVGQIGDSIHVAGAGAEPIPDVHLVSEQRTPVKAAWLMLLGIVGFLGSVASIVALVEQEGARGFWHSPEWLWWCMIVGICCFFLGLVFHQHRGEMAPAGRYAFGTTPDGYFSVGEIVGTCPALTAGGSCGGTLRIRKVRSGEAVESVLACDKYPERHRFAYHPSELRRAPSELKRTGLAHA